MNTQLVVKDLLLDQLNDKLTYEEIKTLQESTDLEFIRAKKNRLKHRERYSLAWLVGSLMYMVLTAVVWGLTHGWTNPLLTAVAGVSVVGVAWAGISQYLDLQKTINVLDQAEGLLLRD